MARFGKVNKTKFVLRKELIFLMLFIVAMIVATILLAMPSKSEKNLEEFNNAILEYNTANSTSFATLEEDHVFKKTALTEVQELISDKGSEEEPKYTYILYGSLQNATILEFLSVINTEAQNREVKNVYFYPSNKVDNQEDKEDQDFLNEIAADEKIFNADILAGIEEVDLLTAPALYVYKNGELIFNSVTLDEDGTYNWYIMINNAFSL